jgi:hypothetical protein
VTDNVYNFVAYIQNPNINSEAYKVKYIFTAHDENQHRAQSGEQRHHARLRYRNSSR